MCFDGKMVQSIVSDSSEGEELSRSYRSFFPSSESRRIEVDKQRASAADAESKVILSVASTSSLSIEDEEVDTVVMNGADENDCALLSTVVDSNVKENGDMESPVESREPDVVVSVGNSFHGGDVDGSSRDVDMSSHDADGSSHDNMDGSSRDDVDISSHDDMNISSHDNVIISSHDDVDVSPHDTTLKSPLHTDDPNPPPIDTLHTLQADDWSEDEAAPLQAEPLHSEESLLSDEPSSSDAAPPIISLDNSSLHNSVDRSTTDLFTVEESPLETCEVVSDSSSSESIDLNATCTPNRFLMM